MMRCPECGHVLCGTYDNKTYKGVKYEYRHYRCRYGKTSQCSGGYSLSELKLEKYLLQNIESLMLAHISQVEHDKKQPKPKPKYNVAALKEQLRRLEVVYMAGNKSDAEYIAESKEIKALIAKADAEALPPQNVEPLRELLNLNLQEIYAGLDQYEKRTFWRSFIKEIVIENKKVKDVIFF